MRQEGVVQDKSDPLFNEKSNFLKDSSSVYQEDVILGDYSSQWGTLTVPPNDILHSKRKRNLYPLVDHGDPIRKRSKREGDQGVKEGNKNVIAEDVVKPTPTVSHFADRYVLNYDTNNVLLGDPYAGHSNSNLLQASLDLPIGEKEAKAALKKRYRTNNDPIQLAMYENQIPEQKERDLNINANQAPQGPDDNDRDNDGPGDGGDDGGQEELDDEELEDVTKAAEEGESLDGDYAGTGGGAAEVIPTIEIDDYYARNVGKGNGTNIATLKTTTTEDSMTETKTTNPKGDGHTTSLATTTTPIINTSGGGGRQIVGGGSTSSTMTVQKNLKSGKKPPFPAKKGPEKTTKKKGKGKQLG